MNKYVFYQTHNKYGFVPKGQWEEYVYNKEITPIRMAILECSEQYCEDLIDLLFRYKDTFNDMIKSELEDVLTIYSN